MEHLWRSYKDIIRNRWQFLEQLKERKELLKLGDEGAFSYETHILLDVIVSLRETTKMCSHGDAKSVKFKERSYVLMYCPCLNPSEVTVMRLGDNPSQHQGESVLTASSVQVIAMVERDTAFSPREYLSPLPFSRMSAPYRSPSLGLTPAHQATSHNLWPRRGREERSPPSTLSSLITGQVSREPGELSFSKVREIPKNDAMGDCRKLWLRMCTQPLIFDKHQQNKNMYSFDCDTKCYRGVR